MSKYDTPCKNCIFAKYTGITQTDCKLNKLELFKQHNIQIIEAFDEEKEFYVIKNRTCRWFRNDRWIHTNQDIEAQKEYLDQETLTQFQAIVFANDDIKDLDITVDSLLAQLLPPVHITIIRPPYCETSITELVSKGLMLSCQWRVQDIIDPNTPRGSMIDYALDAKPHQYYSVFNAGFEVPEDMFLTIHKVMMEDLQPITILLPNSTNNGLTVSYFLHKILQGHHDCGIEHKLYNNDIIKVDPTTIKKITDICQNFPQ